MSAVHWQTLQRRMKKLVQAEGKGVACSRLGLTYSTLRSALEGTTLARNGSFDNLAESFGYVRSCSDGEYFKPQAKEASLDR